MSGEVQRRRPTQVALDWRRHVGNPTAAFSTGVTPQTLINKKQGPSCVLASTNEIVEECQCIVLGFLVMLHTSNMTRPHHRWSLSPSTRPTVVPAGQVQTPSTGTVGQLK